MRNQLIQKLGLMIRGTITDNRSLYTTPVSEKCNYY
ncbi:MAG: hypothetical protein RLZZ358_914 [Bacteroidota bacterium]